MQNIVRLMKSLFEEDSLTLTILTKSNVVIFSAEKIVTNFGTANAPQFFFGKKNSTIFLSIIHLKVLRSC